MTEPNTPTMEVTPEAINSALHFLEHLIKPTTTEIMINPDGSIFTKRRGKVARVNETVPAQNLRTAISLIARYDGVQCNQQHPVIESGLPFFHDARLQAFVEPVVQAPTLIFRIPPKKRLTLPQLIRRGWSALAFLIRALFRTLNSGE